MKKLATLILIISAFNCFSQSNSYPRTVVIGKDTLIAFSVEQVRKITIWDIEREELKSNNQILNDEVSLKDSIILVQQFQLSEYLQIQQNFELILKEKDGLKSVCEEEKQVLIAEVKTQKRRKWLYGIIGFATTSFTTYLWLNK